MAMVDPAMGMMPGGAFPFFPTDADPGAWDFAGSDAEMDQEIAREIGLEGVQTQGEAAALFNIKQHWPEGDFRALMSDYTEEPQMPGCGGLGGCGLK